MSRWNEIRVALHSSRTRAALESAVAVGKVRGDELPEDIADAVIKLFEHPDPQVRLEAVRAIGVHWRLARAARAIAELLTRDKDSLVQLSAIGALGAVAVEHVGLRCFASKILAGVVLSERFADYERMVAYLKLLLVEGRITFEDYIFHDRDLPEELGKLDVDRVWVRELAERDCAQF